MSALGFGYADVSGSTTSKLKKTRKGIMIVSTNFLARTQRKLLRRSCTLQLLITGGIDIMQLVEKGGALKSF